MPPNVVDESWALAVELKKRRQATRVLVAISRPTHPH
jgi:hypothetical protein